MHKKKLSLLFQFMYSKGLSLFANERKNNELIHFAIKCDSKKCGEKS